jgi:hypothetical protein
VLDRDGEDQLHRSCKNLGSTRRVKEERNILHEIKEGKLNELVTFCVGTALRKVLK